MAAKPLRIDNFSFQNRVVPQLARHVRTNARNRHDGKNEENSVALRRDRKMQQGELGQKEKPPALEDEMQARVALDQNKANACSENQMEQKPEFARRCTEAISTYK